jgi:hypothetical protein
MSRRRFLISDGTEQTSLLRKGDENGSRLISPGTGYRPPLTVRGTHLTLGDLGSPAYQWEPSAVNMVYSESAEVVQK